MAVAITQTANPAGVNTSSNVATYSGVAIGAAAANRIVVVLVGSELASASINSVTLGGNAMSAGTQGNFDAVYARAFYLAYPTGTTADIVVTYGAGATSTQNHIAVYSVTGGVYSSTGADQSSDMDTTDRLTTGAITIASGGGFIAIAAGATDTVAKTWANATEDLDVDAGDFRFTTATRTTALTATAVTCTGGTNGEDGALSYLLFTANVSPTVALNSPADTATITDTTPELIFTGTDTESNDIRYNVQVDTVNTFPSYIGIEDNFNDNSFNTSLWTRDSATQIVEQNSRMELTTALAGNYVGLYSTGTFDLTGKSIAIELVDGGNVDEVGMSSYEAYPLTLVHSSGNNFGWILGYGEILVTTMVGGSRATVGYDWDQTTYRWIRLREASGVIYFEYSANGRDWTERNAENVSALFPITSLSIESVVGTWQAESITSTLVLDNLNIYPALIDAVSGTDAGFLDSPDESDTDPFTSGTAVAYTVQSALDPDTYYWRVRGTDPSGSNTYGAWATTRSFDVSASTPADSERGLYTHGKSTANSERGLYTQGAIEANSERGLYTTGSISDTSERGLYTEGATGATDTDSERGLYTHGKDTSSSERGLYTEGSALANSERGLYVQGQDSTNSERGLYTIGEVSEDSERSLYTAGIDTEDSERGLYSIGEDTDDSERGLYTIGLQSASSERGLYVAGIDSTSSERGLYTTGSIDDSSERGLYTEGVIGETSERGLYTVGSLSSDSERGLYTVGQVSDSSERGLYTSSIQRLELDLSDDIKTHEFFSKRLNGVEVFWKKMLEIQSLFYKILSNTSLWNAFINAISTWIKEQDSESTWVKEEDHADTTWGKTTVGRTTMFAYENLLTEDREITDSVIVYILEDHFGTEGFGTDIIGKEHITS